MNKYMLLCNETSGCVFVKDYDFFVSQGGLTQEWGKRWLELEATSIEDARKQGCKLFKNAKPYDHQAK